MPDRIVMLIARLQAHTGAFLHYLVDLMKSPLTALDMELGLLAFCALLALTALLGPAVAVPAHYHDFADQRAWWGVPHALDVLTNLGFALGGWVGLVTLAQRPATGLLNSQRHWAALFFVGLLATAVASSCYHWQPDDLGLAADRTGMAVAFAGLLGLLVSGKVSDRAGYAVGLAVLLLGPLTALTAHLSGNSLPWGLIQFGGMALILAMVRTPNRAGTLNLRWAWVIALYAVAKLLELADHAVYNALGQVVSGHSLKHVVASLAAWPVCLAVRTPAFSGQNGKTPTTLAGKPV